QSARRHKLGKSFPREFSRRNSPGPEQRLPQRRHRGSRAAAGPGAGGWIRSRTAPPEPWSDPRAGTELLSPGGCQTSPATGDSSQRRAEAGRARRRRRRRGEEEEEEEDKEGEGGPGTEAVPPARCALFDPVFSAREAAALRALGLCLLPENEVRTPSGHTAARGQGSAVMGSVVPRQEGKHGVQGAATLFYMVHCGKALYNNLLWSNWSPAALSKLVIIGNSFRGIEERLLSRILERDYSYIAKILKGVEEVALPSHPRYVDTFNDTSVHWFPLDKLQQLSPEVWDFMEEPMYQDCEDLEIIRKGEEATAKS
ncbi:hypothetical protein DV515_00009410, partial [Chloebia gouldiae]